MEKEKSTGGNNSNVCSLQTFDVLFHSHKEKYSKIKWTKDENEDRNKKKYPCNFVKENFPLSYYSLTSSKSKSFHLQNFVCQILINFDLNESCKECPGMRTEEKKARASSSHKF